MRAYLRELLKAILFLPAVFLAVVYLISWLLLAAPIWVPIGLQHDFDINIYVALLLCNVPGVVAVLIVLYCGDNNVVDNRIIDHALIFWLGFLLTVLFGPFYT